jgi:hypothetical protein
MSEGKILRKIESEEKKSLALAPAGHTRRSVRTSDTGPKSPPIILFRQGEKYKRVLEINQEGHWKTSCEMLRTRTFRNIAQGRF